MAALTAGQQAEQDANLAVLKGGDTAAITDVLRRSPISDVTAIAAGDGAISAAPVTAPWILAPVTGTSVSATARELARRAISDRREGETKARAALAALGYAYDGTAGWHISAFATPGGEIGFVNTAGGVAVLTDATLPPHVVTALTVPGQAEGPQVSGAAVWASPDPGEARRAAAPAGWAQLIMDLRGGQAPLRGMSARVVAWCLATCYGRPGEPGPLELDPPPGTWPRDVGMDLRSWPADPEARAAMDAIGLAALDKIARDLAAAAGAGAVIAALDGGSPVPERLVAADRAVTALREESGELPSWATPAGTAVRAALGGSLAEHGTVNRALSAASITQLARDCGDAANSYTRYLDVIRGLLAHAVTTRLVPAAGALAEHLGGPGRVTFGDVAFTFTSFGDALQPAAAAVAERLLAPMAGTVYAAHEAMVTAYQAGGPVEVSIPVEVPGHLPYDPGAPVGLEEIASRLGVSRGTVDQWRTRDRLPEPAWTVGGRPAWPWGDIRQWARRTGRT